MSKKPKLSDLSVDELVELFTEITLAQDHVIMGGEPTSKYNRLFDQMEDVKDEMKSREGDQRRALMPLYDHINPQVRLKAIKATLAVAPKRARRALEKLSKSGAHPQAGEAGMSITNLERGIYKPT